MMLACSTDGAHSFPSWTKRAGLTHCRERLIRAVWEYSRYAHEYETLAFLHDLHRTQRTSPHLTCLVLNMPVKPYDVRLRTLRKAIVHRPPYTSGTISVRENELVLYYGKEGDTPGYVLVLNMICLPSLSLTIHLLLQYTDMTRLVASTSRTRPRMLLLVWRRRVTPPPLVATTKTC